MAYATYSEFLSSINVDSLPLELLDQTVIEDALEDASAIVLSYINVAYENITAPYDRSIKRKTIDIAYYFLMSRRGFNPVNQSDITVANDYNSAIEYLKEVAKNKVILSNKADSANNLLNQPFVI